MLDLKELERQLDEALAKETPQSLAEWLLTQRKSNIFTHKTKPCHLQL